MKIRTIFLLLIPIVIAGFSALNWGLFITPGPLNLGVTEVQAPLGLVMLGALVFMAVVFLVFLLYLQTTVLLDTRQHSKELQSNRKLAEQAEISRLTELRTFIDTAMKRQLTQDTESRASVLVRLEALDLGLRLALEQSENTLSACLGEMEDRLEKIVAPSKT
jgi:hypothetical protein